MGTREESMGGHLFRSFRCRSARPRRVAGQQHRHNSPHPQRPALLCFQVLWGGKRCCCRQVQGPEKDTCRGAWNTAGHRCTEGKGGKKKHWTRLFKQGGGGGSNKAQGGESAKTDCGEKSKEK